MYQVESSRTLLQPRPAATRRRSLRVPRTVVLLGVTSLFTDVSSEMVTTVLPLYVFFALGASPLQVSLVDGLYQGATAILRVAGGFVADRWRRHKEVAAVGYGISAVCKLGLFALGGALGAVASIIVVDRAGKGLRTGPRDAMISFSSSREGLATAFGVHRALDTAGAMLGPLIAFGMLLLAPRDFHSVFLVSFCFALLGLSVLVLLVEPARRARHRAAGSQSWQAAKRAMAAGPFRRLVIAGMVLSLATISDGLFYLGLQRRLDFDLSVFPLLFVGTAVVYMTLAVPAGQLADRIGRGKVLVGAYLLLIPVYAALLVTSLPVLGLAACLLLLGAWYAATDGVLAALASAELPEDARATGLSVLGAVTGLARLVSALLFGALWTVAGIQVAAIVFAGLLVVAALTAALLIRHDSDIAPEAAA
ncbi:MAG TPA: MFS transporter [Thermoleophilaceae bacterium]|jgi:MFS family permease